jgi:hypothetical protein
MSDLSALFKIFFAVVYLFGRTCLVSTYSFGQEDRRFINLVNLPQFVYSPAKNAIQNEKQTPACIRKITFQKASLFSKEDKKYFFSKNEFITFYTYSGNYIDPPPLL